MADILSDVRKLIYLAFKQHEYVWIGNRNLIRHKATQNHLADLVFLLPRFNLESHSVALYQHFIQMKNLTINIFSLDLSWFCNKHEKYDFDILFVMFCQ